MSKKWKIVHAYDSNIVDVLLENREIVNRKKFLHPPDPSILTPKDVGIDAVALKHALARINKAIKNGESIVVYADYDADGITSGAIMWETLFALGAKVMPYIPHRVEEGYGLSQKGIDAVRRECNPTLIITVDHGITAVSQVSYAQSLGIDVIVTDHHTKPDVLPDCTIVHTTDLCGAGVSWFVAKQLGDPDIALAAIGTIADLVPLTGANRSIVKYGLKALNETTRVGLLALFNDAGLSKGQLSAYSISHAIAPRLNAMGRLVHAMDALRLLCTHREDRAMALARTLGLTNKERQQLTIDTTRHAFDRLTLGKLLFVAHESYNPGVIGLVAGKLVEEYYRPSIVVSQGPEISKASARSIAGFNIVDAIRSSRDLLIDVGGHPMAAGFTVATKNLDALKAKLEAYVEANLSDELLTRELRIDMELPVEAITEKLWNDMQNFAPFGFGSPEPVFATRGMKVEDTRLVGAEGKHIKLRLSGLDAIGFGMGAFFAECKKGSIVDIAYTIDMNVWNDKQSLQLKLKDLKRI